MLYFLLYQVICCKIKISKVLQKINIVTIKNVILHLFNLKSICLALKKFNPLNICFDAIIKKIWYIKIKNRIVNMLTKNAVLRIFGFSHKICLINQIGNTNIMHITIRQIKLLFLNLRTFLFEMFKELI